MGKFMKVNNVWGRGMCKDSLSRDMFAFLGFFRRLNELQVFCLLNWPYEA